MKPRARHAAEAIEAIMEEPIERAWATPDLIDRSGIHPIDLGALFAGARRVVTAMAEGLARASGTSAECWLSLDRADSVPRSSSFPPGRPAHTRRGPTAHRHRGGAGRHRRTAEAERGCPIDAQPSPARYALVIEWSDDHAGHGRHVVPRRGHRCPLPTAAPRRTGGLARRMQARGPGGAARREGWRWATRRRARWTISRSRRAKRIGSGRWRNTPSCAAAGWRGNAAPATTSGAWRSRGCSTRPAASPTSCAGRGAADAPLATRRAGFSPVRPIPARPRPQYAGSTTRPVGDPPAGFLVPGPWLGQRADGRDAPGGRRRDRLRGVRGAAAGGRGLRVLSARDGREALALLERAPRTSS